MARILYVCQKCGDEVGEGEQDYCGKHQNCGGQLDPTGECSDEEEIIRSLPQDRSLTEEERDTGLWEGEIEDDDSESTGQCI